MIEVEDLFKSFKDTVALNGVNLKVSEEVHLIIGPNGAGKTTLLKCVMGILRPDSGNIRVFGKPPSSAKNRMAFLNEARKPIRRFRVRDYEEIMPLLYPNWNRKLFWEISSNLSLRRSKLVENMSAGMKAMFFLSLVISSGADVLILDEPTQNLDPVKVKEIEDIIKGETSGKIVLMSSHHLEEVENIADSFSIINRGRVIYSESLENAKADHRVVLQSEITQLDKVIGKVEENYYLVKTSSDRGRAPSLREIALAYLNPSKIEK